MRGVAQTMGARDALTLNALMSAFLKHARCAEAMAVNDDKCAQG